MATDDRLPVTRDEQAVLDQLEQLQQQIEAVRRKRREANDRFDAFLKSFKRSGSTGERPAAEAPPQVRTQPRTSDMLGERSRDAGHAAPPAAAHRSEPPVAPAPPISEPTPAPVTPSVTAAKPIEPPAPDPVQWPDFPDLDEEKSPGDLEPPVKSATPAPAASRFASKSEEPWPPINSIPDAWQADRPSAPAHDHHATPPPLPPAAEHASILEESAEPAIVPVAATGAKKPGVPAGLIALLVLVVLGAVGYFLWSSSTSEPDRPPVVTRREPPPVQQQQPAPTAPAPTAAPPAAPAAPAPAAEITTTRVAWVRVIVDGEIVREGELPAGTKLSFSPTKQFVVRAGDAGAVRVSIAGVDQGVVGRDGIAVTKNYEVK